MSETNHPGSDVALRRADRFFGEGGICAEYERRGDHLVQFHDIASYLANAVPGLTVEAVTRRFLFSVKNYWFGRHGARRTIKNLLDLDSFSVSERGAYSLRPSYIIVEMSPHSMRARRSVWAQWLQEQGWPVPSELKASILIEATAQPRSRVPQLDGPNPSRRPGPRPIERDKAKSKLRELAPDLEGLKKLKGEGSWEYLVAKIGANSRYTLQAAYGELVDEYRRVTQPRQSQITDK